MSRATAGQMFQTVFISSPSAPPKTPWDERNDNERKKVPGVTNPREKATTTSRNRSGPPEKNDDDGRGRGVTTPTLFSTRVTPIGQKCDLIYDFL